MYLSLNEKAVSFSRIKLNLKLGKHTPFQRLVSAPETSSVVRKERKACWESLVLCDLLSNGLSSRPGLVIKERRGNCSFQSNSDLPYGW